MRAILQNAGLASRQRCPAQGVIATAQAHGIQVLSVMDYGCVSASHMHGPLWPVTTRVHRCLPKMFGVRYCPNVSMLAAISNVCCGVPCNAASCIAAVQMPTVFCAAADGCGAHHADVFFNLTYSNSSLGHYWGERWELYKLFYSQTLWMYQRGVTCAASTAKELVAWMPATAHLAHGLYLYQASWRYQDIATPPPYGHELFRKNGRMYDSAHGPPSRCWLGAAPQGLHRAPEYVQPSVTAGPFRIAQQRWRLRIRL